MSVLIFILPVVTLPPRKKTGWKQQGYKFWEKMKPSGG